MLRTTGTCTCIGGVVVFSKRTSYVMQLAGAWAGESFHYYYVTRCSQASSSVGDYVFGLIISNSNVFFRTLPPLCVLLGSVTQAGSLVVRI